MTYDEIVDAALARAMDFGNSFPTTRPVLYRRIEIRQSEIFTLAARVNPDYFGVNVIGVLDADGLVDLAELDADTAVADPTSAITRIEIRDAGTHPTLQCGKEVTLVTPNDREAGLAPRMTLRNFTLRPIPGDMDGVVSVCVFYAYRPRPKATPLDGTEESELPSFYQELSVIDLTKWLLKQSISMAVETKAAALAALSDEEKEMLTTFMAEVADYAGAQVSRFGSVAGSQRR